MSGGVAGGEPARVEVHLVVPTPALAEAALAMLSAEERDRERLFQHTGAREQFLVGRWLLRTALGERLGCAPAAVPLTTYGRGGLMLDGGDKLPDIKVNLSHTAGLVAVALAPGCEVGVDVEDAERRGRTIAIADRFFAPAEVEALLALPEARQRRRFFDLWTLKEAYIKARGEGLAIPLGRFAFRLDVPGEGAAIAFSVDPEVDPDGARWRFVRFWVGARHALAVAAAAGPRPLVVRLRWRS